MSSKKILIFPIPATGHLNPILSIIKELKNSNHKIIVCISESYRKVAENSDYNKCEFRYIYGTSVDEISNILQASKSTADTLAATMNLQLDSANDYTKKIADEIEKEKPDLILYDSMALFAKWGFRIAKAKYDANPALNDWRLPKVIVYQTTFVNQKNIFPNANEEKLLMNLTFFEKLSFAVTGIKAFIKLKSSSLNLGIDTQFDDFLYADTSFTNICFYFPEFQARSEQFHENIKFVGGCINDGPHLDNLVNIKDESMKLLLQKFTPKNPINCQPTPNDDVLIYVSLGTLFKDNLDFYIKVIQAFKTITAEKKGSLKETNIQIIINVGDKCFQEFNKGTHEIPSNIKLVPFAPQLEILKRASLFVTHCGMNSTSEAIWFGVPMICIPVSVDQPLIANHVANELNLGVLLNIKQFKTTDLVESVEKIFKDDTYKQNVYKYSQFSRKYPGTKNSSEIITLTKVFTWFLQD